MAKVAQTEMTQDKVCKSCVRFRSNTEPEKVSTSIYVLNSAFEKLGRPNKILVSVSPVSPPRKD